MKERNDTRPALRRDIDLMPVTTEDGSRLIVVRDPLELSGHDTMALKAEVLGVLALLDGNHSVEDIRLRLVAQTAQAGQLTSIPVEIVQNFLEQLDEVYLLDNKRYHGARQALVDSFSRLDSRPAVLAGRSYPEDEAGLRGFLDDMLEDDGDQGVRTSLNGKELTALVVPHIEIEVGRKLYAAGYGLLRGRSYDRVVLLGVGHNLENGLFCLTDKDFETPLGTVRNDRLATRGLREAAGPLAAPDDFAHRAEHSIEFQLVFLQHVLEGPFSIVPVLCGSLNAPLIDSDLGRPGDIAALRPALENLAGMLSNPGCRTLAVAGVDFSHVGMKFGDNMPGIRITRESTALDKALLAALTEKDVESFCAANRRVKDRFHVCGFSSLAILLEALPEQCLGLELGHQVWHEHATQSAVSFGAAAFYLP